MIPRELESPNRDRGFHWSKKNRATKGWEEAIAILGGGALAPFKLPITEERLVRTSRGFELRTVRAKERRRVTITRYVGSARRLLKDADNLRYTSKPVLDALKRLALVYDDAREWTEHPEPEQKVSTNGTDYTVIRIERLE